MPAFLRPPLLLAMLALLVASIGFTVALQQRVGALEKPALPQDHLTATDFTFGVLKLDRQKTLRLSPRQARRLLQAGDSVRAELYGRATRISVAQLFRATLNPAQEAAIQQADWRNEARVIDPRAIMEPFLKLLERRAKES